MSLMPVIILGAGGHAAVVADALLASGHEVLGFTDADPALHGITICGRPVLGYDTVLDAYAAANVQLAIGIGGVGRAGGEPLRSSLQQRYVGLGWRFAGVRHPSCVLSPFAQVEPSAQLLAGSIVQAGATIGDGCIVSTAAVVEHGSTVGPWVHIAPRALLCGDVQIGARSHVGAGAIVLQGLRIGAGTIIGAGAVVIEDFAGDGTLLGVPARVRASRA